MRLESSPPATWDEIFALFHRLWGAYAAGKPYDKATKRQWCRLLEALEATRDGQTRA